MLLHHLFLDSFSDSKKEIARQFFDLSSNEDEEDGNRTSYSFPNFFSDSCGGGVATRWNAWLEKNVKDNIIIIDISSDQVEEDQYSVHVCGKKRKNSEFNSTRITWKEEKGQY